MTLRNLFTPTAAISLTFGLAFTLAPAVAYIPYGLPLDEVGVYTARFVGAAYLGLAAIAWLVRDPAASEVRRAVYRGLSDRKRGHLPRLPKRDSLRPGKRPELDHGSRYAASGSGLRVLPAQRAACLRPPEASMTPETRIWRRRARLHRGPGIVEIVTVPGRRKRDSWELRPVHVLGQTSRAPSPRESGR